MPYSNDFFDKGIKKILKLIKPNYLFDFGAGAGKYGLMAKNVDSSIITSAIEIEREYILRFKLDEIYNFVLNISMMDLIRPEYYERNFDTVIIGDALEHLKKSDGVDLLNFLVYRTRWIIVQFPVKYLQNAVDGFSNEAHISIWGENDFYSFETTKLFSKENQRLIVIRGYLEKFLSINDIETEIQKNQ